MTEATIEKIVLVISVDQEEADFLTDIPYCHIIAFFFKGRTYVDQAGLQLTEIYQTLPPEC